jgi:N,N'-diacetyllegionaminate synthase
VKVNLIADIGSNWAIGSNPKQRAKELIQLAAESQANVAKFQLFRADKLYRDKDKQDAIRQYELPIEWLRELKQVADDSNIELMITPFYLEAVDELERLGVKRYKIASSDILYEPLLRLVGETKRPVIISTGAATNDEIENAYKWLRPNEDEFVNDVTFLHCVLGYPSAVGDMNLDKLMTLAEIVMPLNIGLSSHCIVPHVTAAAVFYPAVTTIEVHFDAEDRRGVEREHSYTPSALRQLVQTIEQFESAKSCGCTVSLVDAIGRSSYFRDPSDWLRPPLN